MFWLQGLGNKFLSHIREVDSILQVCNLMLIIFINVLIFGSRCALGAAIVKITHAFSEILASLCRVYVPVRLFCSGISLLVEGKGEAQNNTLLHSDSTTFS